MQTQQEKLSDKYKANNSGLAKEQNIQQPQKRPPREPFIKEYIGETGVGKSFGIIQECLGYSRDNPTTAKRGEPVFLFDTNLEADYAHSFPKTIRKEDWHKATYPDVYRILPINNNGSFMDSQDMRDTAIYLAQRIKTKCLLIFDDLDNYFKGAKPRDMSKLFTSYRHSRYDVIITHQSMNNITPEEWAAIKILSLRKCKSVRTIEERVDASEIIEIAQCMIEEQYDLAEESYLNRLISEDEYKQRKSFFLDVDIRRKKILGIYSYQFFYRNCKKYLNINRKLISNYIQINSDKEGKPIYNYEQAIHLIIEKQLMRYFAGKK